MPTIASYMGLTVKNHLKYVKFILSNRNENSDKAFESMIPGDEASPWELWYHGTNNLFRAAHHILDPSLQFTSINQDFDKNSISADAAIFLYEEAVNIFTENLAKLDDPELNKKFLSPISGNETQMDSWIGTNIMHTIGHISQALRLQGMLSSNPNIFNI